MNFLTPSHFYTKEFEQNVITIIEKYPGLGLRELSRELSISAQSLKYYTDKLLQEGEVFNRKDGKYSRYFTKGFKIDEYEQNILSCLRKPHLLKIIIIFLQERKNGIEIIKNQELLDKLQVQSASTVTYYLNQLVQNDVLEKTKNGFWLKNPQLLDGLVKKYNPTHSIVDNFINLWQQYFK